MDQSPLPRIAEDDEQSENVAKEEANKYIRLAADGKTVELISPNQ